ncbi:hypothetical protein [Paenibacillus glycanilyticus]|uniref:Uncharacterized protein n=1 Tax=Paenibacillus glycanilyticus TaxID=126569 RepID=A0ABQ6GF92_9BACL|nr:hypothetical protein [Paenibacillus glycanilyticus]GLX67998.1 hypothetical protein MU1_23430 [Paenibacillus glycanilyticus]
MSKVSRNNPVRDSWNEWSDTWYTKYRTEQAIATIIQSPATAFHPTVFAMLQESFPDFNGIRVLVPSSGDNHAVFAFHLMGQK